MATLLRTWDTYYVDSGTATPDVTSDMKGRIKVYLESQSSSTNISTIRIDHFAGLYGGTFGAGSGNVTSSYRANNGSYAGTYQSLTDGVYTVAAGSGVTYFLIGSTYHNVTHNSDGTAQLYVNGSFYAPLWNGGTTRTSAFNTALPTIPRYATITSYSTASGGLNSINVNWNTDSACDAVEYSLNGGGWTATSGTSFVIGSLNPGTQYSVKIRVKRTDSQLWTESSTNYVTTTAIASITSAVPNISNGSALVVNVSNPSGVRNDVRLETVVGGIATNRITHASITSNTTTFTISEINSLMQYFPNNQTFTIRAVVDTVSTSTYSSYKEGTYTIINSNPVFTTFNFTDTNAVTKAITKADNIFIKGYSNAKLSVTTSNKATSQNYATMVSYILSSQGLSSITKAWSDTLTVEDTLNGILNANVAITAVDSRNNQTTVTYTPTFIDYAVPVVSAKTAVRTDQVDDETTLTFSGTYTNWASTYTDISNQIVSAKYRYREVGGAWSSYSSDLTLTTNTGGNYSFSGTIAGDLGASGFTTTKTFEIELSITDRLATTIPTIITLNSAQPLLWKYKTTLKSLLGIGKKPTTTLPHGSIDVAGEVWSGGNKLPTLKASSSELYTGTDNDKYLTSKTISDANIITKITTGSSILTSEYIDGKQVYVKRINFGALPNNTLKSVSHGIDLTGKTVVRLNGMSKSTSGSIFALPYSNSATLTNNISLYMDGTNINIGTGSDRTAFTETYVYLYYFIN